MIPGKCIMFPVYGLTDKLTGEQVKKQKNNQFFSSCPTKLNTKRCHKLEVTKINYWDLHKIYLVNNPCVS